MWRFFSLGLFVAVAGALMWPARAQREANSAQECECCVVEVIHYGGNLICHERYQKEVVGSGNNMIGRARVDAITKRSCCAAQK